MDQGSLHFQSDGYFWEILGWRLPLPAWLTPGKTFLWHHNDSPDCFNIRIEIRHPLLGLSFLQVGAFQAVPAQASSARANAR